jgi:hypothetical protein
MTQTFLRSYKKSKLNLLNLISSKSQVTQEIAKSTKSQRPFGRNWWRPKKGNFKNNAVIYLKKLKKKCVLQALFVIPAVYQRRMSFVARNAGSIYVGIATLKSIEISSVIVVVTYPFTTSLSL